ncbi:hypothetical protein Rhe02_39090 [Rhizocola hellebori]|uniref:Uncharacterized protein n=1 Tax=Rhizocola hellebori TaxID=1392758 RepID=A0A8J3Q9U1_9ACTN|nr:hypothetical protein Rhe02_39090 [Rhizocola hellebori]
MDFGRRRLRKPSQLWTQCLIDVRNHGAEPVSLVKVIAHILHPRDLARDQTAGEERATQGAA